MPTSAPPPGGFTDCMLQRGAEKVYAVDSGYNQLDWRLRSDPRVVCMERTNARYLTGEQIPEPLDFFSVDVAFISLRLILPPMRPLVPGGGPRRCAWSSPSSRPAGKRWAKKGWFGTRRSIWRCWSTSWTMPGRRDFL